MSPREYALMLLRKALADQYAAASLASDPDASDEVVGFHAQQAVEKLLKAVLTDSGVEYPPTHNLAQLASLLEGGSLPILEAVSRLKMLTPYAFVLRYDDVELGDEEGLDRANALACVTAVRIWAEGILGLS